MQKLFGISWGGKMSHVKHETIEVLYLGTLTWNLPGSGPSNGSCCIARLVNVKVEMRWSHAGTHAADVFFGMKARMLEDTNALFINQLEWTNSYSDEFPVSCSVQQTDCPALHVTLTFLEEDVACTVYVRMMLLRHSTATPSSPRTKDPKSHHSDTRDGLFKV